jgi:hypothetical protein
MTKMAVSGPDPLVRGIDPLIRMRTKTSWIPNTGLCTLCTSRITFKNYIGLFDPYQYFEYGSRNSNEYVRIPYGSGSATMTQRRDSAFLFFSEARDSLGTRTEHIGQRLLKGSGGGAFLILWWKLKKACRTTALAELLSCKLLSTLVLEQSVFTGVVDPYIFLLDPSPRIRNPELRIPDTGGQINYGPVPTILPGQFCGQ